MLQVQVSALFSIVPAGCSRVGRINVQPVYWLSSPEPEGRRTVHDAHDPREEEPERPRSRRRLADALKAVGRIEPLVNLAVQIGSLIVIVTSNWPGHPRG
ncbi:hypothetical protein OHA00_15555 [Streptomyces cellulosae]|nr:hypothetical protein OHA00_15555 [Streptomyces cellulosae]